MAGRATRTECAQSCVSVAIPSGLKAKVSSQVALLVGVANSAKVSRGWLKAFQIAMDVSHGCETSNTELTTSG